MVNLPIFYHHFSKIDSACDIFTRSSHGLSAVSVGNTIIRKPSFLTAYVRTHEGMPYQDYNITCTNPGRIYRIKPPVELERNPSTQQRIDYRLLLRADLGRYLIGSKYFLLKDINTLEGWLMFWHPQQKPKPSRIVESGIVKTTIWKHSIWINPVEYTLGQPVPEKVTAIVKPVNPSAASLAKTKNDEKYPTVTLNFTEGGDYVWQIVDPFPPQGRTKEMVQKRDLQAHIMANAGIIPLSFYWILLKGMLGTHPHG